MENDAEPLNQVIVGDCIDVLQSRISSGTVDLTVFSPPYDALRTYNGFSLDLKSLGDELYRVTKDGGVVVCVIQDGTANFAKSLTTARLQVDWVDRVGFRLFECIIYERHGRPGAWWNKRFRVDNEFVLVFFKGARPKSFDKSHLAIPAKYAGYELHGTDRQSDGSVKAVEKNRYLSATKCRGTVWKYSGSCAESNKLKLTHPATMPDQLAVDLIKCFSKQGDVILDPTCGSGTTLVGAANLKRKFIGIDVSQSYTDLAKARLEKEVQIPIFDE